MSSQKEDVPMLEVQPPIKEQRLYEFADKNCCGKSERRKLSFFIKLSRPLWPQIRFMMIIFINNMSYGMSTGHSSVLVPQLKSTNSSLLIDDNTASWIASSYSFVAPLGCFVGGVCIDAWGRKKTMMLANIGMLLGWVLIITAQNGVMLICARIVEGFSKSSGLVSISVLVDETSDPKLRGSIMSFAFIGYSSGIFAISGLGSILDWRIATEIAAGVTLIALILDLVLRESATWLVRKNRIHEAQRTLDWIWGPGHEIQAQEELKTLKDKLQPDGETFNAKEHNFYSFMLRRMMKFLRIIFTPCVLKPFIIMHTIHSFQAITGHTFFLFYGVDLFTKINAVFNTESPEAYLANVILSIIRIIVNIICTICLLHMGRRTVALVSGVGAAASTLVISIILYVETSSNTPPARTQSWVIFGLLVVFIATHTFGLYNISDIMMGETQSTLIRGFATGYIYTISDFITGALIKNYYSMLQIMELSGLFLLFGLSCVACTSFVYLFLPETKGKTLMEIEDYFKQDNIMWITRNKRCNVVRQKN